MQEQIVKITYPDIVIKLDGETVFQLENQMAVVKSAEDIEKVIRDLFNLRENLSRILNKLDTEEGDVTLPSLSILVDNISKYYISSMYISGDPNNFIYQLKDFIRNKYVETLSNQLEELNSVSITFENGLELTIPIKLNRWNWKVEIPISDTLIDSKLTGELEIEYNDSLHTMLWKLANNKILSYQEFILLTKLGFCELTIDLKDIADDMLPFGYCEVTSKCSEVLDQLDDIFQYPKLLKKILALMLTDGGWEIIDPLSDNIVKQGLLTYGKDLTQKGKKWLEDNQDTLFKLCAKKHIHNLIPYLSLDKLPTFLVSDDNRIRYKAQERMDALKV